MAVKLQHRQHLVAHPHRHRPARHHRMPQRGPDPLSRRRRGQVGHPDGPSLLPYPARQPHPIGQRHAHALLDHGLGIPVRSAPRGAEFQQVLFGIHFPLESKVPALRNAQCFENPHGGHIGGAVFCHDLAHHQLQRQPLLSLSLLRHIAQQAPHRQRVSGLLALAQAQLELQHPSVTGVAAQGIPVHHFAVQCTPEQGRHIRATRWPEQLLERVQGQQAGIVQPETALPGRVGVKKLAARAQGCDHFARILKQIPIALLRFPRRLLLAQRRAAVEGHDNQPFHRSLLVAQG